MQVFTLFNSVFLAAAEAGNTGVSKVTVTGMIFFILFVAVIFILYKFGAKVVKNNTLRFKEHCRTDMIEMLSSLCDIDREDLSRKVTDILNNKPGVELTANILRIELQMDIQGNDCNTCQRILGVTHVKEQNPQLTSAKRKYDFDCVPDDIAKQLIKSQEHKITVILYKKTN